MKTRLLGVDKYNNPVFFGDTREPHSKTIMDEMTNNWTFTTIPLSDINFQWYNGIGSVWFDVTEMTTYISSGQEAGRLSAENKQLQRSKFVAQIFNALSDAHHNYHHYMTKLGINIFYKQIGNLDTESIPANLDSLIRYVKLFWRQRRNGLAPKGIIEVNPGNDNIFRYEYDPNVFHTIIELDIDYVKVDL